MSVFTKSVDSNFRAFLLAPVTWNILGYSLFCDRREKRRVVPRKFQEKKLWPLIITPFFYPSDLVNTKTTIPLRVGEERWIYTSTPRFSVYVHHFSPPLREINYSEVDIDNALIFSGLISNICKKQEK